MFNLTATSPDWVKSIRIRKTPDWYLDDAEYSMITFEQFVHEILPTQYTVVYDSTVRGVYFTLENSRLARGKSHISISFAELDDQEGVRYTFECVQIPDEDDLCEMIDILGFEHCDYDVEQLIRDSYVVQLRNKYYHSVAAFNYTQFELESKGCHGGVFRWSRDKLRQGYTNEQISSTGRHMWHDRYSIRC